MEAVFLPSPRQPLHRLGTEPFTSPAHPHPDAELPRNVYCVGLLGVIAMAGEMADHAAHISAKHPPPRSSHS